MSLHFNARHAMDFDIDFILQLFSCIVYDNVSPQQKQISRFPFTILNSRSEKQGHFHV